MERINEAKLVVANRPWIILGDLNACLKMEESTVSASCMTRHMQEFEECVNNIEVEDVCSSGIQFIWTQKMQNRYS